MRPGACAAFAVFLLLHALPGWGRDLVALPAGRVYSVRVDDSLQTVWVALTAPTGEPLRFSPAPVAVPGTLNITRHPTDVAFDNRHDTSLLSAFRAALRPATDVQGAAIEIEVDVARLRQPGTYDLRFTVTQGPVAQELMLQVVIPEAHLRIVSSPSVERIIEPWGAVVGSTATPFVLVELSRRSRVTLGSDASGVGNAVGAMNVASGPLQLRGRTLPPGGIMNIDYTLSGDFPLGAVRGVAELSAPELMTPLVVPYEVRTRLAKWWLAIVIGVGALMGSFTRNWFQTKARRERARMKLRAMRNQLLSELKSIADPVFAQQVSSTLEGLEQAEATSASRGVASRLREAEVVLADARKDFEVRRASVQVRLRSFEQFLRREEEEVPYELESVARNALEVCAGIQGTLDAGNVEQADQRLTALVVRTLEHARSLTGNHEGPGPAPRLARLLNGLELFSGTASPSQLPVSRVRPPSMSGRTLRELLRSSLSQSLTHSVLFYGGIGLGFLLFQEQFIGTPGELVAHLVWGLALGSLIQGVFPLRDESEDAAF